MTTTEMLMRLPFAIDWVSYKGEICVAHINFEATEKAKRPMLDISYCMTQALNNNILKTVQWDRNKFKPCHLSDTFKEQAD